MINDVDSKPQTFCIELDPKNANFTQINALIHIICIETNAYIQKLAKELGINERTAADIYYLRSRSRWTKEEEQKIIDAYKSGNPIEDIFEWNG